MKTLKRLIIYLSLSVAGLVLAKGVWLNISKTECGYLFKGAAKYDTWSFDITGSTIQTFEDRGRAFANIDGIILQILRTPIAALPEGEPLEQHYLYETNHLEKLGVLIEESNRCSGLNIPHKEWRAVIPGKSNSTYLTIYANHYILSVVVATETDFPTEQAITKLESLCMSLNS